MKSRYFFDMDGTMAVWNNVSNEELYRENYFLNLDVNDEMIALVNQLLKEGKEVYSCSHFLEDSHYALKEKNEWLDIHLPLLNNEHRVFIPYGQSKAEYFNEHGLTPITNTDFLIDDYTPNLFQWEELGGTGIKFLNGINHTHKTWQGIKIDNSNDMYNQMFFGIIKKAENKETDLTPKIYYNNYLYMCILFTDDYTVYVNVEDEILLKNNKDNVFYQNDEKYSVYHNLIAGILSNEIEPLFDIITSKYAFVHNIYDMKCWNRDGFFAAEPGQEITKDIYNQFFNCMLPLALPSNELNIEISSGFMMGEPYNYKEGQQTYLAFGKSKYSYYYLGEMDKNGRVYNLGKENKLESEDDIEIE
ncbi:MAG: hypothetical protein HFF36_07865 [Coprobacillus sp.]|nr:hypothetical protein [Coprobacillus sp.]